MSTTTQTPLVTVPPILKIVISGEKGVGKSTLGQLLAGQLRLLGHDVTLLERTADGKLVIPITSGAKDFKEARAIKIEVKESK